VKFIDQALRLPGKPRYRFEAASTSAEHDCRSVPGTGAGG
jgi:hypothetical protein